MPQPSIHLSQTPPQCLTLFLLTRLSCSFLHLFFFHWLHLCTSTHSLLINAPDTTFTSLNNPTPAFLPIPSFPEWTALILHHFPQQPSTHQTPPHNKTWVIPKMSTFLIIVDNNNPFSSLQLPIPYHHMIMIPTCSHSHICIHHHHFPQ